MPFAQAVGRLPSVTRLLSLFFQSTLVVPSKGFEGEPNGPSARRSRRLRFSLRSTTAECEQHHYGDGIGCTRNPSIFRRITHTQMYVYTFGELRIVIYHPLNLPTHSDALSTNILVPSYLQSTPLTSGCNGVHPKSFECGSSATNA